MADSKWRSNGFASAAAALVIGAALLASGATGCQSQSKSPAMQAEPEISDAKIRAVAAADAVISQGEKEIGEGNDRKATDSSSAGQLIKQGEDDVARGNAMKARAAAMK